MGRTKKFRTEKQLEALSTKMLKRRGYDAYGRDAVEQERRSSQFLGLGESSLSSQRLASLMPVVGAGGSIRVTKSGKVKAVAPNGAILQCTLHKRTPPDLAADANDNALTNMEAYLEHLE